MGRRIIQIYTNLSASLNCLTTIQQYHSMYRLWRQTGSITEGLPTWVPRDYAVSAIAVKLSDDYCKCSAIYDSTHGGLVIRVIEHTMAYQPKRKSLIQWEVFIRTIKPNTTFDGRRSDKSRMARWNAILCNQWIGSIRAEIRR